MEEIERFKNYCLSAFYCPRKTKKTNKCLKDSIQEKCFKKYCLKLSKDQIKFQKNIIKNTEKLQKRFEKNREKEIKVDEKWLEVQKRVWNRDAGFFPKRKVIGDWMSYCRFWKCLTLDEKEYVLENYKDELATNSFRLDVAHIKDRSTSPELKYDSNNCVLMSRFFHSRLTQHNHPIYNTPISGEEVEKWYNRVIGFRS